MTTIAPPAAAPTTGLAGGVAALAASGLSNQVGAATGALAFPVIGPVGVVSIRQFVAAGVLMATVRPPLRSFTRQQWWPVLCLGLVFGTMNLTLYAAIDRIGLGLAVTLEFLGPMAIALATTRRRSGLAYALAAAVGVAILSRPQPTTDYLGIALGLVAAACWAAYILLNRVIGARLPGLQGTAAAAGFSALLYLPVGVWVLIAHPPTPAALGCALTTGVLSSIVPYAADIITLRRVPPHLFGILMSMNPVIAALVGLVVLHQVLGWSEVVAMGLIVLANVAAVASSD
ncbi:inner membrane transporter RhtA [Allocatelliglobosispora scoriae]|uniref:Inner membrane transporter RhtA n=1 Tax=Allocatelliglobosispora scoriae TaxID=643052 RepID=A0A841BNY8_9ACTN|nr:EamA family transporter [Allocatelliglobosispora scoriae]MBB5869016.1 inner membrane transporter RhtA [Allocatelliglobosispora scoriae]